MTIVDEGRFGRWVRISEWPLVVGSLAFLIAYAVPIIKPEVPDTVRRACTAVTVVVWVGFVADYVIRVVLVGNRWRFVKRNLPDLLILTLPMLRPLRLLRLLALLSVLNRAGSRSMRGRVVTYAAGGAVMLLVIASLAVTDAERGQPGANISGVGDGLWWSLTTMTTVGYGDRFPVTLAGRLVAVALMIAGIALLGVVTGIFASWLVESIEGVAEEQDATQAMVRELVDEVRGLRRELADARSGLAEGGRTVRCGSGCEVDAPR